PIRDIPLLRDLNRLVLDTGGYGYAGHEKGGRQADPREFRNTHDLRLLKGTGIKPSTPGYQRHPRSGVTSDAQRLPSVIPDWGPETVGGTRPGACPGNRPGIHGYA